MSATTTFAPSAARPSASARPIPLPAPVTIATRPAQRSPIACSPPTASSAASHDQLESSNPPPLRQDESYHIVRSLTTSLDAPLRRDFVALFITAPLARDKAPTRRWPVR